MVGFFRFGHRRARPLLGSGSGGVLAVINQNLESIRDEFTRAYEYCEDASCR